jgi:5-methylcytosine-specific restriction enzyme A
MPAKLANPASLPWREFYGLALWKTRRRFQLAKEPLCAFCLKRGQVTPATVADHIEPHRGDFTKFVRGDLQSLCSDCHNGRQSPSPKNYSSEIGYDGFPIDKNHPFNCVR